MANAYSIDDVLDFLSHAGSRGLMPSATAGALGSAMRSVVSVLSVDEQRDLSEIDPDSVVKRFNNRRARDFNPASLKEYSRRFQRAIELFLAWRNDPSNFSVKTRTTSQAKKKLPTTKQSNFTQQDAMQSNTALDTASTCATTQAGGYSSSISLRADWITTIHNIPANLTAAEAARLSKFISLLVAE